LVKWFFANKLLFCLQLKKDKKTALSNKYKKVLVIADLNIGDAVNIQSAIVALHKIGIKQIDYAVNKTAAALVEKNPYIPKTFPVFNKANKVSDEEISYLNEKIRNYNYDLVINFCPFLSKKYLIQSKNFISFLGLSIFVTRKYFDCEKSHITYLIHSYINKLFNQTSIFEGNFLYLPREAIETANTFYRNNIPKNKKVVMLNIDATSIYTLMPFSMQREIADNLSEKYTVILSASFSQVGLQEKLYKTLNKNNIILLDKHLSITSYAALIDLCDAFISADTGGLHIAASYKYDEKGIPLNNKTAIFSIFGATPAKIYAYDSEKKDFLKSSQSALSKVYISNCVCKNITCINKSVKCCRAVRCFYGLETKKIISDITNYLGD